MSSSSSKSSFDSGRRPATGPGIGGNGGTVIPPPVGACAGRAVDGVPPLNGGTGCGTDDRGGPAWSVTPLRQYAEGRRGEQHRGGQEVRAPEGCTRW